MKPVIRGFHFLILALLLLVAADAAAQGRVVITSVTVIDVTDGSLQPDQTVIVEGNRIAFVGPAQEAAIPDGAEVVDGEGRFLIPGLWDMHVHTLHPWSIPIFYPLYPALGITGVREMGNSYIPLSEVADLRRQLREGELLGPRFLTSGHELDAAPKHWPHSIAVRDAEHGRFLVDSLLAERADFIKVYENLPRDVYYAIVERAKERDVPFVGHTPEALTPAEVSDAGQRSIEHWGRISDFCTSGGDEFYWASTRYEEASADEQHAILEAVLRDYDPTLCRPLFERFVRNDTWIVPTLATQRGLSLQNDSTLIADPRRRYVPRYFTEGMWDYTTNPKTKDRPEEWWTLRRELFRKVDQPIVGQMRRAGVQILAGSDAPSPHVPYGFGLHDELELLVEAGLTPLEALQAATINPALFLGQTEELGTVEVGKLADLVLLDANPLEDIAATQRIRAVVVNGRLLDQDERERIFSSVENAVQE